MNSLPNNSQENRSRSGNAVLDANAGNCKAEGKSEAGIGPNVSATGSGLGTKAVIALGFLLAAVLIGYLALTTFKSLMPSYTPKEKSNDSSVYTATDTYENKGMTKVEPNRTIIIRQGTDNTAAVIPVRPTPEAAERAELGQQGIASAENPQSGGTPATKPSAVPVDPNKGTLLADGTFVPDSVPVAVPSHSAFEVMPPELARRIAGVKEEKPAVPVLAQNKEPTVVQVRETDEERSEKSISGALSSPMMGKIDSNKNKRGSANTVKADSREFADPENNLNEKLMPAKIPAGTAGRIFNRYLTLAKGTFINCILETKVDTTVPGMTSCRIPENLYSMDGRTVLVEAGSRVFGEYRGSLAQGQDRVFVLWTQIHTPHGVVVNLDSPGTDPLGGAGHGGEVDYHWWERFGNALLFSLIDDSFNFATMKASERSDGVSYYTTSQDSMSELISEAMKQTGQIPPTIHINQGTRIGIFTARNIDMSSVYELKPKSSYR